MNKHFFYSAVLLVILSLALFLFSRYFPAKTVDMTMKDRLTLVLDPGHGGADGGANVNDVFESRLNLDIARKLDNIMGLFSVPVVLTRNSEDLIYPPGARTIREKKIADQKQRIALINATANAVLISIHQNKFSDSAPQGAQVFFSGVAGSEQYALLTQDILKTVLNPNNRRAARPIDSDILLMRKTVCPAILVECGFMSNPDELRLLQTDTYQTKLAICLAASFFQAQEILKD
ncbi:MAG: N-acetylmuramoyl-L-alanine amidase [Clostridiales bacterium]|jgi:N-acetylmuramoyl-L-alanine amidase|nr:N-acetylmuramoyl-L-alanine amidase [Clostridiales bacterium]